MSDSKAKTHMRTKSRKLKANKKFFKSFFHLKCFFLKKKKKHKTGQQADKWHAPPLIMETMNIHYTIVISRKRGNQYRWGKYSESFFKN